MLIVQVCMQYALGIQTLASALVASNRAMAAAYPEQRIGVNSTGVV